VLLQEVGEEEHFQDGKDDEELDEDNGPQRTPQFHVLETVVVEVEDSVDETIFPHRPSVGNSLAKIGKKNITTK
jgi:hypothetical protein